MLKPGNTYTDNNGEIVPIAGRIDQYSDTKPWVYSSAGFWYHEVTGQFVSYTPSKGHILFPGDAGDSINLKSGPCKEKK